MAVYTQLNKIELANFLNNYNLGKLISYFGIIEGIENTNFKLTTDQGNYILTLFEKRVNPEDLPFFVNLQIHLSNQGLQCPIPMKDKDNKIINSLCGKKAIIASLLEGKKIDIPEPEHCFQVGKIISKFQSIAKKFKQSRKNTLDIKKWKLIFSKCMNNDNHIYMQLIEPIKNEMKFLEENWPINLPSGIIHGDLFQDNIFFQNKNLSGLIDFYFSCNDYYAYELAITTNAWCFCKNNKFKKNNFRSLIDGYQTSSKLNNDELKNYNILLRGAAMRILVTRLHDYLYQPNNAIVIPKDPLEYFNILNWHQKNSVFDQ